MNILILLFSLLAQQERGCSPEKACPPYEPPTLEPHNPPAPVLTAPDDPKECPYTINEPSTAPEDEPPPAKKPKLRKLGEPIEQ
jgi:hypothetical protein